MKLMFQLQLTDKETKIFREGRSASVFYELELRLSEGAEAMRRIDGSKPVYCQFIDDTGTILKEW